MKVSIIIPFYNASNYIITCINCLKKQKHKNFEALFINDGSDDDWHNLFNNEKDERMFSITIKKGGVSKARNEGIKIATGELITFLDIDDEYTPDFISNIVEKYKNENYDICFCDYIEIYNNGNKIIKKIKNLNNDNLKLELISKLLGKKKQNEKLDEMFGSVWRCAFSKTFMVKNNLLFDTNITIAEDLLFIIKSIMKAKTISFIDKELYLYYIRANSTLNSYKTNKFDSDIILHFEIKKELTNASLFKGDIIDRFYQKKYLLWVLMLASSILDVYLQQKYQYSNYTVSKTFLTMLVLAYLKHYDDFILSHKKTNKTLDFIAKYSFGLFFVHWYWFFIYNQIYKLPTVIPVINGDYISAISIVLARFFVVALVSFASLFIAKTLLLKINKDTNTRKFLGI